MPGGGTATDRASVADVQEADDRLIGASPVAERWRRWWTRGLGLGLAVVGLAMLCDRARSPGPSPSSISCRRAARIDGQLRCDDELPRRVEALCTSASRGPVGGELRAGDAVDTAQLCAHSGQTAPNTGRGWSRMPPEELAALRLPIDINQASVHELTGLPRIGPVLARRIVAGRPYADLSALGRIRGIGPVTLERLRPRVIVGVGVGGSSGSL